MKKLHLVNKVGIEGEDIACRYLEKKGFKIIDRNYLKKWGEIDIIARKAGLLHFIEVKTVTREINLSYPDGSRPPDTRAGVTSDEYRPEENVHPWKLKRLQRVIQSYLLEKFEDNDPEWQFEVAIVLLDMVKKVAKVELMEVVL